jgi:hypothetical protein
MTPLLWFAAGWWACLLFSITVRCACGLFGRKPPTLRRRNRDRPIPERKLFDEIKEGMADLERERNGGVDYKWLGMTGSEQE